MDFEWIVFIVAFAFLVGLGIGVFIGHDRGYNRGWDDAMRR